MEATHWMNMDMELSMLFSSMWRLSHRKLIFQTEEHLEDEKPEMGKKNQQKLTKKR